MIYRTLLRFCHDLEQMLSTLPGMLPQQLQTACSSPLTMTRSGSPEAGYEDAHSNVNQQFPRGATQEFQRLSLDVATLLQLYDRILDEERYGSSSKKYAACRTSSSAAPTHEPNDSGDNRRYAGLECDFCGADIFQSYFECKKCRSEHGSEVLICPGCASEGRQCRCRWMMPVQRYSAASLEKVQSSATKLLKQSLLRHPDVKTSR